jgi:uncharacterized membrane protein YbhN (UPF0104 family)
VTLLLAGVGLLLTVGKYPVGVYLWIEGLFVIGTIVAGFAFFSRSVRARLRFAIPWARKLRIEKPARAVYDGLHGYRDHPMTLVWVALVTALAQIVRVIAIYASGRAVGIDLGLLPYVALGPLLFLVMLVPFTVNGLGVREGFFVSFLNNFGISHDAAFACGLLFFVSTLLLALPGVAILLWENVVNRAPVADGTSTT